MHSGASPPQPELPVQVQVPPVQASLPGQSLFWAQTPQISLEQPGLSKGQSAAV